MYEEPGTRSTNQTFIPSILSHDEQAMSLQFNITVSPPITLRPRENQQPRQAAETHSTRGRRTHTSLTPYLTNSPPTGT